MYITPAYNKKPKFVDYSNSYSKIFSMQSRGDVFDYRSGVPSNATYTRTGVATGLTSAGVIQSFAADAPQRTDRGLAIEPARTNLAFSSYDMATVWSKHANSSLTNGYTAPDGTSTATRLLSNSGPTSLCNKSFNGLTSGQPFTASFFVKQIAGSQFVAFILYGAAGSVRGWLNTVTGAVSDLALSGTYSLSSIRAFQVSSSFWRVEVMATVTDVTASLELDQASASNGYTSAASDAKDLWGAQLELGAYASSPIPTTSATVTRGLPIFTEPVPSGRTKALLTYADASTTLVTGLTPGGTFDVATAVIGANKGRFGASELVTREWQA